MSTVWRSKIPQVTTETRKRVSMVVRRAAFDLEARAKIEAPVDTGFLRSSIQTEIVDDLTAIVFVGAEYGIYVNYGTTRQPANPFFDRAIEAIRPEFEREIAKL